MAKIKKAAVKTAVTTLPAKAEPKADAPVKAATASKYKGRTTGLRVMTFQDATFTANVKAMLTDEELAAAWRAEFPAAVAFTVFHVKGARRDFNAGTHAKATPKPETPLAEVIITNGRRHFVTDVKAEAAPVEAPKAKAKAVKATTRTAKAA